MLYYILILLSGFLGVALGIYIDNLAPIAIMIIISTILSIYLNGVKQKILASILFTLSSIVGIVFMMLIYKPESLFVILFTPVILISTLILYFAAGVFYDRVYKKFS